jgi:tetratricopeptide (TPR) repeat protein
VKAFLKAKALVAHQDAAGAENALKAAVEAEGGLVTARILLAEMLMARQDYEGADAQYLGILKVEADNLVALNNLAFNIADHLGRPQDALPYAQRAYTIGGRAASVADTLGWVYHLLGDNDQAMALLSAAARGADRDPTILLHAARAFQAAGRPEPARAYLDRALLVQPALESSSEVQALKAALK